MRGQRVTNLKLFPFPSCPQHTRHDVTGQLTGLFCWGKTDFTGRSNGTQVKHTISHYKTHNRLRFVQGQKRNETRQVCLKKTVSNLILNMPSEKTFKQRRTFGKFIEFISSKILFSTVLYKTLSIDFTA